MRLRNAFNGRAWLTFSLAEQEECALNQLLDLTSGKVLYEYDFERNRRSGSPSSRRTLRLGCRKASPDPPFEFNSLDIPGLKRSLADRFTAPGIGVEFPGPTSERPSAGTPPFFGWQGDVSKWDE